MSSIVLDILLVIIVLMMVPIGFFRGGLREVCTAAGVLLGVLLAQSWAPRWASVLEGPFKLSAGGATFLISILIVFVSGAIVGYGGSAAFSYKPGPGGRMYGSLLAFLTSVVTCGFLINTYIATIHGGQRPVTIGHSWIARALSQGFDWILLAVAVAIVCSTIFGMFVRERGETAAGSWMQPQPDPFRVQHQQSNVSVRPLDDPEETIVSTGPVRIREVRHWEPEPDEADRQAVYGKGWRATWPDDAENARVAAATAPRRNSATSSDGTAEQHRRPTSSRDTLKQWVQNQSDE